MADPKYEELVAPRLDYVKELAGQGASNEEIMRALNIGSTSFYRYKQKYSDFNIAILEGRKSIIIEVKNSLLKRALGYDYTETKHVEKTTSDGKTVITDETVTKYQHPSESAAVILLRNLDKEFHDRDFESVDVRKQELDLKKKVVESKNWLSDDFIEIGGSNNG